MADRILRTKHVTEKVGFSRTTIFRKERDGEFPRRRMIGDGIVGYLESEIDDWIKSRPVVQSERDPSGRLA
jgi:prophage regulatory protein